MSARSYPVSEFHPTEGHIDGQQIARLLDSTRDSWDGWLSRVQKNGPTDVEAQKMLLQVGAGIELLERVRTVYLRYPPEGESPGNEQQESKR